MKKQDIEKMGQTLKPKAASEWASILFDKCSNIKRVRINHKTPVTVEIVAKRVYEAIGHPFRRVGPSRWLLVERISDGSFKYYVSSLPVN